MEENEGGFGGGGGGGGYAEDALVDDVGVGEGVDVLDT